MNSSEFPLFELFTELRAAGLSLGIQEYKSAVRALKRGFGLRDPSDLKRLCRLLWVKSREDQLIFDSKFDAMYQTLLESKDVILRTKGEASTTPSATEQPASIDDTSQPAFESPQTPDTFRLPESAPSNTPESLLEERAAAIVKAIRTEHSTELATPTEDSLLSDDFYPITRRQLKQSWRYFRRMHRDGHPSELDLEGTIKRICQVGFFLEPSLIPPLVNQLELVLFIDHGGSMAPFHALARRIAETAIRGGRLKRTKIYYFHNCPVNFIYQDPSLKEAVNLKKTLASLKYHRSAVMIISDAGAARGRFNSDRVLLTQQFIKLLKLAVRNQAWLNPVPSERWNHTTADEIASLVPMFEVSRHGVDSAIDALRGRYLRIIEGLAWKV